jgi:hypothetical protein
MPHKPAVKNNLQRDTLRKIVNSETSGDKQRELAHLRLLYSEDSKLLTGTVNKLVDTTRLYLHHLPTQTSGRWSTWVTNWPRECINQECPQDEHEWTDQCWSVRDILLPDSDEILITWDHDNIEGKIHDLIINDEAAIKAHEQLYDLHTITCCDIFGYDYPSNLKNPHTSEEDSEWRSRYNWQGKDTRQRVLAKNFNHGAKYTESYKFVHNIKGIERYGVTYEQLEQLAENYIASKGAAWQRKLEIMKEIRVNRIARSLYGFRRVFFDSTAETGRQGFSHMVSATVSDYNNETLGILEKLFGERVRLLHNAHDGDKIAVKKSLFNETFAIPTAGMAALRSVIERPITYNGKSLIMTAGIKIYT